MQINDIKERLEQERKFGSRFPVRMIFADNLKGYLELEEMLKGICDATINVGDYCRAEDTVPQFSEVNKAIARDYLGKHVLLLSAGEYLRFCIKREMDKDRCQFPDFWETQQPESSYTRIIVPVFCSKNFFDRILGSLDDCYPRQQDYAWRLDVPPSDDRYRITVYSSQFKGTMGFDADGLQCWLKNWQEILKKKSDCQVMTMHYRNAESCSGIVSVRSFETPFQYICNCIEDSEFIDRELQSDKFWSQMIKNSGAFLQKKPTLSNLILNEFNLKSFDFVDICCRWKFLSSYQKGLVWLWYRAYPDQTYYSFACQKPTVLPLELKDS